MSTVGRADGSISSTLQQVCWTPEGDTSESGNASVLQCVFAMFQRRTHSNVHVGCQAHNGEPPPHSCVGNDSDLAHTYQIAFLKAGTGPLTQGRACWPNYDGRHSRQLFC